MDINVELTEINIYVFIYKVMYRGSQCICVQALKVIYYATFHKM